MPSRIRAESLYLKSILSSHPSRESVTRPMREIDGRWLYYMFLAGTRKVVANQERLNRINVFPVKDGDTGANMAFTLTRSSNR
jgi:hypothetical protein